MILIFMNYFILFYNYSGLLSFDSTLRCDMVDLYYALYGTKRPLCIPTPELSAILKPQKIHPISNISGNLESRSRPISPYASTFKTITMISGGTLESTIISQICDDDIMGLEGGGGNGGGASEMSTKRPLIVYEEDDVQMEAIDNLLKKEELLDIDLMDKPMNFTPIPENPKKQKTDYYSDNSASLPGLSASIGDSTKGPVGFEPGMFNQDEDKGDSSASKSKKKKKDKKKHKHKHKHKHNKDKDKLKDKKDSNISRLVKEEETQETLSSGDSTSNSNPPMDLTM